MFWLKSKVERQLSPDERKKCIQDMLDFQFPIKLYLVSFAINIFLSANVFGFQIAADRIESPNYFVYAG